MGVSSSKTKSTNKPIYSSQIEGASSSLSNAYNTAAPTIQANSNMLSGLLPGMIDQYKAGDSGINAARGLATDTMGGKYLDSNPFINSGQSNPHLDQMVATTSNNVQNQMGARIAKMGLGPAGSTYQGVVGRQMAESELGMRYGDYNTERDRSSAMYNAERDRMGQMASLTPSLTAADIARVAPMLGIADAAQDPLRAAVGYSSGQGGLLGQYQDQQSKTSNPWGPMLMSGLSNAAAAFAGG